jgi:Fe-S-cluster-containing dehydrogenase component
MTHRWGMAVDLDRCTGCEACVTACRTENNVRIAGPEQSARGRSIAWIRVERYYEGDVPTVRCGALRTRVPDLCEPSQ